MCSRRDHYLKMFSSLRTHVNRTVWSAATLHRAPYKPFLLLAVLTQFNCGAIHRNFIEPSIDLERIYTEFCNLIQRVKASGSMASPFISLQNSGFWKLAPRAGKEYGSLHATTSVRQLRRLLFGARLNADLFPLLQMKSHRNRFTDALVHNYFSPAVQLEIRQITEAITSI